MHYQRGRPHKSAKLFPIFEEFCNDEAGIFPEKILTPFANAAASVDHRLSFKHIRNTHAAYRLYTRERWRMDTIKLTWNFGEKPFWAGDI